ncbi:MAG: phosphopantothenoylcysteine decarboxylase domain-containing protein [Limisphaerales bacterium]
MKCLVTAGPTYEPLDEVRRLTNFSTGRLGSGLADFLVEQGHEVVLLLGAGAVCHGAQTAQRIGTFTTTTDLRDQLHAHAGPAIQAVFHAAAVSDFAFGAVWKRGAGGTLTELRAAKLPTRDGPLLVELRPTPKIIAELRGWFPEAHLIGWKFELDGDRAAAVASAGQQLIGNRTDACVVNGRAYGDGFGLVTEGGRCLDMPDAGALYAALARVIVR